MYMNGFINYIITKFISSAMGITFSYIRTRHPDRKTSRMMIPAMIIYLVTDQTIPIHIFYVLLIIGVFAVVQLIDNLVMSPYIMGSSVGLHPMLVIILVLLGASISGILGMLFAVPIAAIMKVIVEELSATFNKH